MTKLQKLRLESANGESVIKLKYIQHLLSNLKNLRVIDFKNLSITCEENEKTEKAFMTDNFWNLEILNLGIITIDFWSTFTGFLKGCPFLRELTLCAKDKDFIVNINIIDILSRYCQQLHILNLENCDLEVDDFMPLKSLKELSLISCHGFLFENLQQVLGGLKLNTFKLINTPILDINNSIYISPSLKHITIDSTNYQEISEIFQNSLNNLTELESVNWSKGDINHNWIADKCPKLKKLSITNPYHLPRIIFSFKSLQELILTSSQGLSWNLLKTLICKLSLKRLELNIDNIIVDKRISQDCEKFHTTLEYLKIPFELFKEHVRYWLNVLDVNEKFGMVIYGKSEEILNVRLLCLLLAEDCVQMRLKRIKICGYNLGMLQFSKN